MRASKLVRLALALSLLLALLPAPPVGAAPDAWSSLAAGIDFQIFHLASPRPINLFIARLQRSQTAATIDTAIAHGALGSGRETVSEMAARADGAISYWGETWGNRNRAVVAINGYFFNLSSGEPLSGQALSGWYAKRFSEYVGDAGFAWGLDRSAFIGKCVYHQPINQFLTVRRSGEIRKINAVNQSRGADEVVMYTPQYGASTQTNSDGVEVLVEMSRPTLVLPEPAMALGTVVRLRDGLGNTPIPFDHVVLSAAGTARTALLDKLQKGDEIGISQEISNCPGSPAKNWTKVYATTGGDYHFLTNGELTIDPSNPDAGVPNSRTAVAYSAAYVYFVVVDGWNRGVSEGISVAEMGRFLRDTLSATDAVTLDSGGSSTMVVNGQVVNNTYCNFTRNCGMRPEHAPLRPGPDAAQGPALEPLVGNALLMVAVEPKLQAPRYAAGQEVFTLRNTELRLGPGTSYAVTANLTAGAQGSILSMQYRDLNGIMANGVYWQRAEFGSTRGWIKRDDLYATNLLPGATPGQYLPLVGH